MTKMKRWLPLKKKLRTVDVVGFRVKVEMALSIKAYTPEIEPVKLIGKCFITAPTSSNDG
ncbi:hypothetical protein A8A01_15215 [Ewingella americana]|nr:hypothetical protein A8A01_15215 [Ewingella americana]